MAAVKMAVSGGRARRTSRAGKTSMPPTPSTKATGRGVVYLGRIPHGFYEDEMRAYFAQFGKVTRVRLSRNRRTGNSKHYAFVEFESDEVAKIVAETMDNYILYKHVLICKHIPANKVHPDTFQGAERKFKVIPWNKIHRERVNEEKPAVERLGAARRLIKRDDKRRAMLAALGIDYDFPGYATASEELVAAAEIEVETVSAAIAAAEASAEASGDETIVSDESAEDDASQMASEDVSDAVSNEASDYE